MVGRLVGRFGSRLEVDPVISRLRWRKASDSREDILVLEEKSAKVVWLILGGLVKLLVELLKLSVLEDTANEMSILMREEKL